tara:strand:- start:412 stop:534 length:123 start_codon:yes stop_codon:yes gene_type:complete
MKGAKRKESGVPGAGIGFYSGVRTPTHPTIIPGVYPHKKF